MGKPFAFYSDDVYADYYSFASDPDLESFFENCYSAKTRDFFKEVMEGIGLTSYTEAEPSNTGDGKWEALEDTENVDYLLNGATQVGKMEDGRWLAQTSVRMDINSFLVLKMYFDRHPTREQISTAFDIRNGGDDLTRRSEVFSCLGCGHQIHWLDVPGDLCQKRKCLHNMVCGCDNPVAANS